MVRILAIGVLTSALLAVASAGGAASGPRTFGTRGAVVRIAADGTHVAVLAAGGKSRCAAVVVFDTASKRFDQYDVKPMCPNRDHGAVGPRVDALVLGAGQVVWVETGGGNKLEYVLQAATLGRKAEYQLAFITNGNGAEGSYSGDWIGNVRGQGSIVAYGSFSICEINYEVAGCYGKDPTPGFDDWQVLTPKLVKLVGRKPRAIRKEIASLAPVAVDAGRIALASVGTTGPMVIVDAAGAVKATVNVPAPPAVAITDMVEHVPYALEGGTLYVLRSAALEAFDIASGKLAKTVPLPAGAKDGKLAGATGGIVAVLQQGVVYAVRASDGATAKVTAPKGAKQPGIVDAWITRAGLFSGYDVPSTTSHGRVAFLPLAALKAHL